MANEADILVRFGADVGPLSRGAKKASGNLDNVKNAAVESGKGLAKLGAAAAAAGVAFVAFSKHVAENVTELSNQATVANTSIAKFKSMAFAAKSVGIEQDNLSDILKDVNDKIGDFVQTGAGPMVDFFEKIAPLVGVTVDEFKDLSGDKALKLYIDSLNKANLSQSDMTFYMEAIASDATKLLPLYANQSKELERLTGKYEDVNEQIALTAAQAESLGGLKESFDLLGTTAANAGNQVISAFAEPLSSFLESTTQLVPVLTNKFIDFFNTFREAENINSLTQINAQLDDTSENIKDLLEWNKTLTESGGILPGAGLVEFNNQMAVYEQRMTDLQLQKEKLEGETAIPQVSIPGAAADGDDALDTGQDVTVPLFDREILDIEQIAAKEHLEKMTAMYDDYNMGRLAQGEDFSKTDLERQKAFAKSQDDIEKAKNQKARDGYASMFGDLASLTQSGNKTIFNIGKAAAIAQAGIDGISAGISSFKYGASIGGPVLGSAFAAASALSTGAMISKLMNTSSSGGGGSGSSPAVSAAPTQTPESAGEQAGGGGSQTQSLYIEGIDPGSMFSGDQVRSLIDKINEAGADGKQVILT